MLRWKKMRFTFPRLVTILAFLVKMISLKPWIMRNILATHRSFVTTFFSFPDICSPPTLTVYPLHARFPTASSVSIIPRQVCSSIDPLSLSDCARLGIQCSTCRDRSTIPQAPTISILNPSSSKANSGELLFCPTWELLPCFYVFIWAASGTVPPRSSNSTAFHGSA